MTSGAHGREPSAATPRSTTIKSPQEADTDRLCATVDSMKDVKSGSDAKGFDSSSGWNCTPHKPLQIGIQLHHFQQEPTL